MTVEELIKSLTDHLKTYPEDKDLKVQVPEKSTMFGRTVPLVGGPQYYPEDGKMILY